MYRVIGKRPGLLPTIETACDYWLGCELSELMLGYALGVMPDGLVIEQCEEHGVYYLETNRMQLVPIDPKHPGEMVTTKRLHPVEINVKEYWQEVAKAKKLFAQYVARYK